MCIGYAVCSSRVMRECVCERVLCATNDTHALTYIVIRRNTSATLNERWMTSFIVVVFQVIYSGSDLRLPAHSLQASLTLPGSCGDDLLTADGRVMLRKCLFDFRELLPA